MIARILRHAGVSSGEPVKPRSLVNRGCGAAAVGLSWAFFGATVLLALTLSRSAAGESLRAPASEQVVVVTLCRGQYEVTMKDGTRRRYGEPNLAFKIETGELGPPGPPTPVLAPSHRFADRAFVIFPSLEALKTSLKPGC